MKKTKTQKRLAKEWRKAFQARDQVVYDGTDAFSPVSKKMLKQARRVVRESVRPTTTIAWGTPRVVDGDGPPASLDGIVGTIWSHDWQNADHSDQRGPEPVRIKLWLRPGAAMPKRSHADDSAYDLYLPGFMEPVELAPGQSEVVLLGIRTEIPAGWACHIHPRSSTQGLVAHGIIDAGYRGDWCVRLHNTRDKPYTYAAGDRIAQVTLERVHQIEWATVASEDHLASSARDGGGFGSSGR